MKNAKIIAIISSIIVIIFLSIIVYPHTITTTVYTKKGLYTDRVDQSYQIVVHGITNIPRLWNKLRYGYRNILYGERNYFGSIDTIYAYKIIILRNGRKDFINEETYKIMCREIQYRINTEGYFCLPEYLIMNPDICDSMYTDYGECIQIGRTFIELENNGTVVIKKIQ